MSLSDDQIIKLESYLDGTLKGEQKVLFEKEIDSDKELQKYVSLQKEMSVQYNDSSWQPLLTTDSKEYEKIKDFLTGEEAQEYQQLFTKANDSLNKKKKTSIFSNWFLIAAAASIAILVTWYSFNPNDITTQEIYDQQIAYIELPSLVDRGNSSDKDQILLAQNYFNDKEYKKAAMLFEKELKKENPSSVIYMSLAISQMQLKRYPEAEQTLDELINSDLIDAEKGYWLKSLLHIKRNELTKARSSLKNIIANSYYNHQRAQEVLDQLSEVK